MNLFKNFVFNKFALTILLIFIGNIINLDKPSIDAKTMMDSEKILKINNIQLKKSEIILELNESVAFYIHKIAPKSKLLSTVIVNNSIKYNMDITFVMAQAMLESHFGTKGQAKKTNSVFNVGTYDNGKILCVYKNPNESVEPYMKLIKNHYLKNKTIDELLKDRNFKNLQGKRFASRITYEQQMRHLIKRIKRESDIYELQQKLIQENKNLAQLNTTYYGDTSTIKRKI